MNQTYLNIYRYDPEPSVIFPQGTLVPSLPISAFDLGLDRLQIADFAVLGNRIYLLDHTQGVYSFEYYGNKVQDLVSISLADLNITEAWGISANFDGGYIQIVIATE